MANAAITPSDASVLGEMLPVDPFRSLFVHFGMLMGVEDFNTLDAYHRGKMWFHSAWLHGEGTIWGLQVSLDEPASEARVGRGAALDKLGRELYLGQDACLNIGAWYEAHKDDAEFGEVVEVDDATGEVTFDAHVVMQFKACLNRQVPALTEPCDGTNATTAYSRVLETVELLLLPGRAPQWRTPAGALAFHRVRLLLGLEEALEDEGGVIIDDDQEVLDARADILTKPEGERAAATLDWFRYFSAKDEMALEPARGDAGDVFSIFPGTHPTPVPLANLLGITLAPADSGWSLAEGSVDNSIRPVHLPTSTIQELLCCSLTTEAPAALTVSAGLAASAVADAGGPRVSPDSVEIQGEKITFSIEGGPMMKASVDARGLSITAFDIRDGWVTAEIKKVRYHTDTEKIEVELRDAPGATLVRIIVKGTGEYPFLGRNRIPLAGVTGGEPGTKHNGNDFIFMVRARS